MYRHPAWFEVAVGVTKIMTDIGMSLNSSNAEQKAASPAEAAGDNHLLRGDWKHEAEQSFSPIALPRDKGWPVSLLLLTFFFSPSRKVYSSGRR